MKFTELQIFNNYNLFKFRKNLVDLYGLFKIITTINPSNVLEIGYHEGLTFGLMVDSLKEKPTTFTSCDITYDSDKLKNILSLDKCEFHAVNSTKFVTQKTYDFIIIDGEHDCHEISQPVNTTDIASYTALDRDFRQFYNNLDDGGIMMIGGDKSSKGVEKFIKTILPEFPEMQPIIIGHHQVFIGKNFTNHLSLNNIIDDTKLILTWNHVNYFGFSDVLDYSVKHSKIEEKFIKILGVVEK